MARFRKKLPEVDAVQFTGDNWAEMHEFTGHSEDSRGQFDMFAEVHPFTVNGTRFGAILWNTLANQWDRVAIGWWIVKGPDGNFYVAPDEAFQQGYEPIDDLDE
jgi:hypothetical protein